MLTISSQVLREMDTYNRPYGYGEQPLTPIEVSGYFLVTFFNGKLEKNGTLFGENKTGS